MSSRPGPLPSDRSDESPQHDWASQLTALIERVVGTVRDKATGRAVMAVRAVVFGVLAAFVGLMAFVLFTIIIVRILEVYLPIGGVWLPDLIIGMTFVILGLWCWSRTRPARESA